MARRYDKCSYFEEDPDEEEFPFSQLPNSLLRDKSLSPNCRWLICYLLSNEKGWRIHMPNVIDHVKGFIGRDSFYKILNEALNSGYLRREDQRDEQNPNLRRVKYFLSKTRKFKKFFPHPEFQDPEAQDPDRQDCKEYYISSSSLRSEESIKNTNRRESQAPPKVATPSESATTLASLFLSKMREILPTFKEPNMAKWAKDFDHMLRLDKRTPEQITEIISWWPTSWWRTRCASPRNMRENFDKMVLSKAGDSEDKFKKEKQLEVKKNKAELFKFMKEYPESARHFVISEEGVRNSMMEVRGEARFDLPSDEFLKRILWLCGG